MSNPNVDFDFLSKQYFYFDKPVPYVLDEKKNWIIEIKPIKLADSEIFLSAVHVISQDKDSIPDPKIIQMSYLQFVIEVMFNAPVNVQAMIIIAKLCLGIDRLGVKKNELGRYCLIDQDTGCQINQKQFDEIRKIIMKQNFADYDDEYMHPDLKKALDETKELKNKYIDMPALERKMAIITAHCGLPKHEQERMTYRSHCMLFKEVCGEVNFNVSAPIALQYGKGNEFEDWIFKKTKGKFDDGVISVADYNRSAGGNGEVGQGSIQTPQVSDYI